MARETSLDYDKLVKLVKQDNEITQGAAAQKLGLSIGQVSMLAFCQAKVEAGAATKAPGTPASIKKLRDNEGNRWELIAARTGLSVAAVKAKYEEAGGDAKASYTGRGRDHAGNGNGNGSSSSSSARRTTTKRGSATKAATKPSAKRGPATKTKTKSASRRQAGTQQGTRVVRRTTRRSGAANPS